LMQATRRPNINQAEFGLIKLCCGCGIHKILMLEMILSV